MRKIIHIDMDAFYASIEQRDQPELRGLPIAVGGSSKRGVVMTASYQARQFGVRSAMPVFKAENLCPDLIIVPPRFDAYKTASRMFREILEHYSQIIEPLSLDEAFIDVTEQTQAAQSATNLAQAILTNIEDQISVTASAGVSFNKFLAKLASGMNKPNGLCVIKPTQARTILADLAIERFHGVGPATAKRLKAAGIYSGLDLQQLSEHQALEIAGSTGRWFWQLAQGIDDREVSSDGLRKSISVETTFIDDVTTLQALEDELMRLTIELTKRAKRAEFNARTLTVKLKYNDFQIRTRSQTWNKLQMDEETLVRSAKLTLGSHTIEKPVRLIGVGLSRNNEKHIGDDQLDLPFS